MIECPQYSPSVSKQEENIRHNILCARICTTISGREPARYRYLKESLPSISGGSETFKVLLKNIYMQLNDFEMVLPNVNEIPAIGYTKEMTLHTILFDTTSPYTDSSVWWDEAQKYAEKTKETLGEYPDSVLIVHGLVRNTIKIKPSPRYIKYLNQLPEYQGIRGGSYCQTCTKTCKTIIL